jgi:hypothetical protein
MSERKAFNFYKSYYDVFKEINTDKDKLAFILALLERQFDGTQPTNLKGEAKFAYVSQREVIDAQIKGWEDKTGKKLSTPTVGGSATPSQQEKEKEKGQEKEQEKVKEEDLSLPPTLDSVEQYFIDNGYTKESAKKAFDYYNASLTGGNRKWTDSKGNVVKNWKQKMRSVWFKEENKVKPKASSDTFTNSQGQTINKSVL